MTISHRVADPGSAGERAPAQPARPDPALLGWGGVGALVSGAVFVLTLAYTFGFLASRGLSVELLDTPAQLLPWIDLNTGAYMGLWGLFVLALLALVPAPLALAELAGRHRAATRVATLAGIAGVVVGLAGAMVNTATAPALGAASRALSPALLPTVLLVSDLMGSIGLYFRLLSEALIGAWLAITGAVFLRQPSRRLLGRLQLTVAAVTLAVVLAKALYLADWEPFLGLWLALGYLGVGAWMLKEQQRAASV